MRYLKSRVIADDVVTNVNLNIIVLLASILLSKARMFPGFMMPMLLVLVPLFLLSLIEQVPAL